MFAGLQNDESVAFHVELVAGYYETLTFLLLKRVQPVMANDALKPEDKEFALNEITKVIQLPLNDYVTQFAKFKSRVQNARNIRITIPKYLTKMIVDLAVRDVDPALFDRICEAICSVLDHTERNSGRIFSAILKELDKVTNPVYRKALAEKILAQLLQSTAAELTTEIPDANKQTVGTIVKKCELFRRMLYTMNKNGAQTKLMLEALNKVDSLIMQTGTLLVKVQMKEKLALKMLSPEDLKQFMAIKTSLLDATILMINLGWTDAEPELQLILTQGIFVDKLASPVLQKGTDRLEEIVFRPQLSLIEAEISDGKSKLDYELYFDAVRDNEGIHEAIFDAMSGKMLLKDQIEHYAPMIASCIET